MRKITNKEEIKHLLIAFDTKLSSSFIDDTFDIRKFAEKIYDGAMTYATFDGTDPSGFISFYVSEASESSYITLLAVAPIHQGTQIAYSLLTKCIEISTSLNKNSIKLEVNKNNIQAIKFYNKNGFTVIEDASKDSYYMEKPLH